MIVGKHFEFEASHQLPDEECYGKCRNLHGHTYKLIVEVEGEVNDKGWVLDFKELKKIVHEEVISKYDHCHLNNFFDVPTAENILQKIHSDLSSRLAGKGINIKRCKLYETSNSYASIES